MAETSSLENKVAIVTGGSRGIGRAIALELAARGAAVVVNYHKSSEAANEAVKKIQEAGGKAAAFQADVSDLKQAEALVNRYVRQREHPTACRRPAALVLTAPALLLGP